MRFIKLTVTLSILLYLFTLSAAAENYNVYAENGANKTDYFDDIKNMADVGSLGENLPSAADEVLHDAGAASINRSDIEKIFDFGFIFNMALNLLGKAIPFAAKSFAPIFACIIIGALLGAIRNLNISASGTLSEIIDFVMIVLIAGITFSAVRECFILAKNFIAEINSYMTMMMPVMASLSTVSGNIAAAAANSAGLYAVLNVTEIIGANIVLPILQICYSLALVQSLVSTVNISGIAAYIRSVVNFVFIFVMTTLITIILFQNILASSADNLAARTIKFTVSSFIPVVGGLIGEASRTVIGSMQAVKSVTGIFGIFVILATLLPPLLNVIVSKFMLKICGGAALILGMDRHSNFLKEMNSLLDITLALMISISVVFVFAITVFIKTAAA